MNNLIDLDSYIITLIKLKNNVYKILILNISG
jgi:hypothetical protein